MLENIKQKLKSGEPTIGSWMQIPNSSVAEIMGKAGYDWVAVDMEHGHFSNAILPDICRALELGGTVPFCRVAQCGPKEIKQALDAGARGIILPMIETADQLEKGIAWSYYPPQGVRGVGYGRANLFGKEFEKNLKVSSDICIVAQIEHIRAVENLDLILTVEGLDAIFIGPYDLSGSVDLTGQFEDPRFLDVMDTVDQKAREYHVPMGIHVVQPDENELKKTISKGYQFIAYGIDAVFLVNAAQNSF